MAILNTITGDRSNDTYDENHKLYNGTVQNHDDDAYHNDAGNKQTEGRPRREGEKL